MQTFDSAYALTNPNLVQVDLAGTQTNLGWAEEEALDVEWSHVMAPAASIVVVEAASANTSDLMNAVNVARNLPNVTVVTMSWGGGEFRGEANYDSIFRTPAGHTGVTFVAASGDNGARGGAGWPDSSPNVVAVGGTSLTVNGAGNTVLETAWSGSGGGYSVIEPEPSYQLSVQHKSRRSTPDVAMVADPNTGVLAVVFDPVSGQVSTWQFGGTSLSAELFGGLIAVADQGRVLAGLGTLDGPTQTLPLLYAVSSADFRDITLGSNGHRATPGYDQITGRGTPVGNLLVHDLSTLTAPAAVHATPARTKLRKVAKLVSRRAISDPAMHAVIDQVPFVPIREQTAIRPRKA